MDRRAFLKGTLLGSVGVGLAGNAFATGYYPQQVDQSLFAGINRVKDAQQKSSLEKSHAPAISAPATVKGGEPFTVEVAVGENLHVMSPPHWIEHIELLIGNDPAGRVDFQSKGYLRPKAVFTVIIPREAAPLGKVTLVAQQRCNLHGLWEATLDLKVV